MPNYDAKLWHDANSILNWIVFWMMQSVIVKKLPFKNLSIIKLANNNIIIS